MTTVLDASVFIHGYGRDLDFEDPVTTPAVIDELESEQAATVRQLIGPTVQEPAPAVHEEVAERARADELDISGTDTGVVALARQRGAVLVTDDYSLQDLAARVGVEVRGFGEEGISEQREYERYCPGCGKVTDDDQCPRCGTATTTRQRSSRR